MDRTYHSACIYIYCISWQSWWRHQMEIFSASLAICAGNSPVNGEFPAQRPVTRGLMFSFICAWINVWVNNREAGDLRRHRTHYDVTLMVMVMGYHRGYELHVKLTNCNMWHIGNCLLHVYYPWIFQSLISHRNNIQYDFITADIISRSADCLHWIACYSHQALGRHCITRYRCEQRDKPETESSTLCS